MHFTATELLVMQHWLFIWKEISSSLCLFTEVQIKYMLPPPQVSYTQTCLEAQQQRSWTCPSSLMMRRSMFGLLSSGTSTWGRRRRTGSGELAKLKKHDTFHCFLASQRTERHLFDAGSFDGLDFWEGFCTGASDGTFIRLNSLAAKLKVSNLIDVLLIWSL